MEDEDKVEDVDKELTVVEVEEDEEDRDLVWVGDKLCFLKPKEPILTHKIVCQ